MDVEYNNIKYQHGHYGIYNIPYDYIYSGILTDNRWSDVRPDGWDDFLKNRKQK